MREWAEEERERGCVRGGVRYDWKNSGENREDQAILSKYSIEPPQRSLFLQFQGVVSEIVCVKLLKK